MRTYRIPVWLTLTSCGGLILALAFEGLLEYLGICFVASPLVVVVYHYVTSRREPGTDSKSRNARKSAHPV
jgi:hypothetical protein